VTSASSALVAPPSTTFVTLTVSMPYSKADFDSAKQDKYKAAMAAAAGTSADNVDVVSVTETTAQRRAGSIDVETKVIVMLLLCGRSAEKEKEREEDVDRRAIRVQLVPDMLNPHAPLSAISEFLGLGSNTS